MNHARLLLAIEVLDFLRTLRRSEQEKLLGRCREIASFPAGYLDYFELDSVGRRIGVHVFGNYVIKFWDDPADRHLKILDLHLADYPR